MFSKSIVAFGVLLLLGATNPAAAKEVTSGGIPPATTPVTCNPIKSLTMKSDTRVSETGLAATDLNYSVTPCDKNVPIRTEVTVAEWLTHTVVYSDTDAASTGKFTVFGIKVRTTYQGTVTVYDALTGEVLGTQSVFTAAIPKGV